MTAAASAPAAFPAFAASASAFPGVTPVSVASSLSCSAFSSFDRRREAVNQFQKQDSLQQVGVACTIWVKIV